VLLANSPWIVLLTPAVQELEAFLDACRTFGASFDGLLHAGDDKLDPRSKDWVRAMEERAELLSERVESLEYMVKQVAPVTSLLSDKRNVRRLTLPLARVVMRVDATISVHCYLFYQHLVGFLDDAVLLLERSHAHRLEEMQARMASLMESYRRALLGQSVRLTAR
jgi:hypothetical protein